MSPVYLTWTGWPPMFLAAAKITTARGCHMNAPGALFFAWVSVTPVLVAGLLNRWIRSFTLSTRGVSGRCRDLGEITRRRYIATVTIEGISDGVCAPCNSNRSFLSSSLIINHDSWYAPTMDIAKIITALRQEKEQLDMAIISLERLARSAHKRRGRPPAWMAALNDAPKRRGRPPGSKNKPKHEASA